MLYVVTASPTAAGCLQALHGDELPYQKLGYRSVVGLMSVLSDVVVLERLSAGDFMLYDSRRPRAKQIAGECL